MNIEQFSPSLSIGDRRRVYQDMVQARKACHLCSGLVNPAAYPGLDTEHIGPWTAWQGRLDAEVMIIGQDFGDERYFLVNRGHDAPSNPTNRTLSQLLDAAGVNGLVADCEGHTGRIYLTNVVLCLKQGGLQGNLAKNWVSNCSKKFLLNQINMVRPKVLICLGVDAFAAVTALLDIPFRRDRFREFVEQPHGLVIPGIPSRLFAVYHCGRRCLNMTRSLDEQMADWARLRMIISQSEQPTIAAVEEKCMRCIPEGSDVQWRSRPDGPLKRGIIEGMNAEGGRITYTVRMTHENGIPVDRLYPCHPHATWLHKQNPHLLRPM